MISPEKYISLCLGLYHGEIKNEIFSDEHKKVIKESFDKFEESVKTLCENKTVDNESLLEFQIFRKTVQAHGLVGIKEAASFSIGDRVSIKGGVKNEKGTISGIIPKLNLLEVIIDGSQKENKIIDPVYVERVGREAVPVMKSETTVLKKGIVRHGGECYQIADQELAEALIGRGVKVSTIQGPLFIVCEVGDGLIASSPIFKTNEESERNLGEMASFRDDFEDSIPVEDNTEEIANTVYEAILSCEGDLTDVFKLAGITKTLIESKNFELKSDIISEQALKIFEKKSSKSPIINSFNVKVDQAFKEIKPAKIRFNMPIIVKGKTRTDTSKKGPVSQGSVEEVREIVNDMIRTAKIIKSNPSRAQYRKLGRLIHKLIGFSATLQNEPWIPIRFVTAIKLDEHSFIEFKDDVINENEDTGLRYSIKSTIKVSNPYSMITPSIDDNKDVIEKDMDELIEMLMKYRVSLGKLSANPSSTVTRNCSKILMEIINLFLRNNTKPWSILSIA
jgi:hypothetical protein